LRLCGTRFLVRRLLRLDILKAMKIFLFILVLVFGVAHSAFAVTDYIFPILGDGEHVTQDRGLQKNIKDSARVKFPKGIEITIPKGWTLESKAGQDKSTLYTFKAIAPKSKDRETFVMLLRSQDPEAFAKIKQANPDLKYFKKGEREELVGTADKVPDFDPMPMYMQPTIAMAHYQIRIYSHKGDTYIVVGGAPFKRDARESKVVENVLDTLKFK
jgi:hypothetical protein